MFDINLTREAIATTEDNQTLNRRLSHLLTDITKGRGYMILQGASTVSVVSRQDGERRLVKVYPLPILEAKRYTKEEAERRVKYLKDPSLYRVVRLREALAIQGDALAAYLGELQSFQHQSCNAAGMEIT